ncbi:coniferyl aldehyde dehydrogenase [Endozoicomonas sp. G2_1]|uniref:coniferyl aldehyde dehydrogenase n=1 Tax=Endozoicomonas sp. G2_1 TaxID=2821091 RepID=UPI001ADA84BF|nr:coniferyl aldehyde dehydrogenase [Endozoicomonas sp. G2_1]
MSTAAENIETVVNPTIAEMTKSFNELNDLYAQKTYPSVDERISLLKQVKQAMLDHEIEFYKALNQDYGYRSEFDSMMGDFLPSIENFNYAIKKIKKWTKPDRRHSGLLLAPSKVEVHYQPLGVVGIIVPWNFPIYLSMGPLITALAAGNRAMIKLSEFTPAMNAVLIKALAPFNDHVRIFEGEADVASAFSKLAFDHILFTGSTTVGRFVARAAAENLTPITLELGGKSPVIINKDADLNNAVHAVMLGKSINGGQICVSPDYVFIPKEMEQDFVELYLKKFTEYYLSKDSVHNFTHVINENQFKRLASYIDDAKAKGATIHTFGDDAINTETRRLLPHLMTNVTDDMLVMQDEIFGALLPIKTYENLDEALNFISARPRPLALYLMTNDNQLKKRIVNETHSGGVCINDSLLHVAAEDAPFGGVGDSGMGQYHGIEGFRTFSKAKTVLSTPTFMPRSRLMLKNRDMFFNTIRKLFLK